jgi:hypothetical protein
MKLLTTLSAVALLALTGCGVAAETTAQPTVKPHNVREVENALPSSPEEDEAGWDCLTMGNKICGANPIERVEAWGAFRTDNLPEATLREAFKVTYHGVALTAVDFPPADYVTIPSAVTAGKSHVFLIEKGQGQ